MKRRGQIGNTMFAAITLGIIMLLIAGVMGSQCGRASAPPVVIVDTVVVKSDTVKKPKSPRKKSKKKSAIPAAPQPGPTSRNYRDEVVN